MVSTYCVINLETMICENIVLWDPMEEWMPGTGKIAVIIPDCAIGDEVQNIDDVWSKV